MKKYLITFLIESGKEKHIESVEIEATTKESAQTGAFKTKIIKKYNNKGYRYYVVATEIIDA